MTWTHRIISTVMIGISIAGLCSLAQPAASIIVIDPADSVKPANSPDPRATRIQLTLRAFMKVMSEDPLTGDRKYVYLPLTKGTKVKSGTIIRYLIIAKNGNRPIKNLAVTQPIPTGTTYTIDSAKTDINAELLFSINGGQSYVAQPTIEGRMANPAEYTNLRWRFNGVIPAEAKVQATYEVEVK
jgi:uncharacterized repeat protein (TIGR01451 family)